MSGTIQVDYLTNGTRILNTTDGELGIIVNGFSYDEGLGSWCEYEVETAYEINRWQRSEIVRMSEVVSGGGSCFAFAKTSSSATVS